MKTIFCSYPQDLMRTEHRRMTFIQLFLICLLATSEAWAITRTWSGASGNWSDPAQWSPNGVPQNGDDLVFNNSPGASLNNDITGLSVRSLTLHHTGAIVGNALTVTLEIQAFPAESGALAFNFTTLYLGGDITLGVNNGTGWGCTLNCSVVLNGFDLTVGSYSGPASFQGSVYGPGNLIFAFGTNYVSVVQGPGVTAPVQVTGGTLFLDSLTSSPITESLKLYLGPAGSATVSLLDNNQLGSSSTVVINGGSQLLLNGFNTTIGNLVLTNSSSDLVPSTLDTGGGLLGLNGGGVTSWNDNSSVIPTIKGDIDNIFGTTVFNVGGSVYAGLDIWSAVGNVDGISKTGTAALLLEATSRVSGAAVSQGILDVRTSGLGDTFLVGGVLTLRNVSIGGHTLTAQGQSIAGVMPGSLLTCVGACSWSGPVQLSSNLVVVGDITLSGAISGQGGIGFFGGGTSLLGGTAGNLYTGTTLVRCPLLEFGKSSGVNAYAGPLVVGGGAGGTCEARWLAPYQNVGATLTLYANGVVNLNNHNEDFGVVTFNGGEVDTGTGQFAFYQSLNVNPAPVTAVINGYLGLPPPGPAVFIVGQGTAGCDLQVNAVMFGTANYFVKQGTGTMCLTALNTFAGVTLLEDGILDINNGLALSSQGCVIFDGATLRLEGTGNMANGFEMVGAGAGGTHGALELSSSASYILTGNILLDTNTTLNVGLGANLELIDSISGNGPLTKSGAGALYMIGAAGNTYAGDTLVSAGTLYLAKGGGISVPGNLVIGPASSSSPALAQLQASGNLGGSTVTVNANGLFDLNGFSQTLAQLNLNDGGSVQTEAGTLGFSSGGQVSVGSLSPRGSHKGSVITGNLAIAPNDVINFNVAPYAIFFPFDRNLELNVLATIPRPVEHIGFAPAGITKAGGGRMRLGGNNTYAGYSQVNGGTIQVDGTQPSSPVLVNAGATLSGAGTVGAVFLSGGTSVVRPGDHPGILNCGSFNRFGSGSGTLQIELNGTGFGQYDQLVTTGLVALSGITLSPLLNYASAAGDQFVILKNNGPSPVSGTFTGLPQNGTLYLAGEPFQINYAGGAGKDVVLSRLATSGGFTGTGQLNSARYGQTATLLGNGKVLFAGGYNSAGAAYLNSAELYDPASGTWTLSGSLNVLRDFDTATLLPNGQLLVVGGETIGGVQLTSAELYDPRTGAWTLTGSLHTRREAHTATLLPNGKVLVAGGYGSALSSAELYDPASGTWSLLNPMTSGHANHSATLLSNGKVLVAGGYGASGLSASAELYDPANGTWTPTGSLSTPRGYHTATLLPNGQVLVAGGDGTSGTFASAELYDPGSGTWTGTGSLTTGRRYHTASLLPNGQVLAVGGFNDSTGDVGSAELYDPGSGLWAATGSLSTARHVHTAVLLSSGQVLVAGGGAGSTSIASAELFDLGGGTWTPTSNPLNTARQLLTTTLLPSGQVLVAGGYNYAGAALSSAELYDPASGTWSLTGPMQTNRVYQTATLLASGLVLVAGGYNYSAGALSSAELYDPASETWSLTGPLQTNRANHTATLLANGRVLVAGGSAGGNDLFTAELYDPASGTWSLAGPMQLNRAYHTATLLPNGKVLVVGGENLGGDLAEAELYDPSSGMWTATGWMYTARESHTATLMPNGKVLVAGGYNFTSGYLSDAELYDPASGTWTVIGPMNAARGSHTATLLPGGKVLVAGGGNNSGLGVLSSAELFDPASGTWAGTVSMRDPREYAAATLLPNGQVLVAGGFGTNLLASAELYATGLGFSNLWQPQITSVTSSLGLGSVLSLTGSRFRGVSEASGGNSTQDAASDYPVAQLRAIECAQTLFLPATNWSANSFISLPITNFPTGWAMLTVFVNGIPSAASLLSVRVQPALPIILANPTRLPGGAFQFSFTSVPGATFTVLGSTSAALPMSNWPVLGGVPEISPGLFQFTDVHAGNYPARLYRVRSP
jgi:autotransporter-associated beta strand protein